METLQMSDFETKKLNNELNFVGGDDCTGPGDLCWNGQIIFSWEGDCILEGGGMIYYQY